MKTSLKINLVLTAIIISYLLIAVRGEHLGGPLGLFLFMNLFSKEIFYGLIPMIGIILLIVTMFANVKRTLYIISMLCLYTCLILYSISLVRDRAFVDEVSPILSMLPFISLSIFGGLILRRSRKIE